jgi:hypothetical protein
MPYLGMQRVGPDECRNLRLEAQFFPRFADVSLPVAPPVKDFLIG